MRVSLIICTYNRAGILEYALESLTRQTADTSLFEIIVVDNNSPDNTRDLTDRYASRLPNIRYVPEMSPGLNFARDTGFNSARSDWVVYLDDDIRAYPDLVERLIHVIDNYEFDCFGGWCLPWYKYGRPRWLHDRYVINEIDPDTRAGVLKEGFAMGALIAFRRSVLEELGGFAAPHGRSLGMKKDKIAYGEETLVQVRMKQIGYTVGFDPLLKVDHLVHKDRLRARWFLKMRLAKGRDYWDTFGIRPTWLEIMKRVPLVGIKPLLRLPGSMKQLAAQRDYYLTNVMLDTLYPAATLLGQIYGGMAILLTRYGRE